VPNEGKNDKMKPMPNEEAADGVKAVSETSVFEPPKGQSVPRRCAPEVIKIKRRNVLSLARYAQRIGVMNIAVGQILVAGGSAHEAIFRLSDLIQTLVERDDRRDLKEIAELMRLQVSFGRLALDSGVALHRADKEVSDSPPVAGRRIPFPAGTQMSFAVESGPPKPPAPNETPCSSTDALG
jgi:hypothetical protein